MKLVSESLAVRGLRGLSRRVCRSPRLFFYPQVVLFAVCVFYTVTSLEFHTDRNALVGSEKQYHHIFLEYLEEFPAQDDLVVVVESEDIEKNRQFVERLGTRIEAETNLFSDVFYKGDLRLMGPKALLFIPERELEELHGTLREYRPFIEQFTAATNLNSLFGLINAQFRNAGSADDYARESLIGAIPALQRIVEQANASLHRGGTPPSPGIHALFGASEEAERQMYITFDEGRVYLVTARAGGIDLNDAAVNRVRQLVLETQREIPGLNVGVTGEPVLEYDEMLQARRDATKASLVALTLCVLLFAFSYRETGRPLKAVACLVLGLGYTMGFTTLVVGHLNILTITFVPILIGLAIDFGIHLITRYEEELRRGRAEGEAMETAMVNTGLGIFTGAFTTTGAFLAMALTDFKGVREMGIICGFGMLLCLFPMMTMLPVLLLRGRQNVLDHRPERRDHRARVERFWLERPGWVVGITAALTIAAIAQVRHVRFDYNLLNLQSKDLPAVVYEHKLIETASKSVLYAVVVADDVFQANDLEEQIRALPSVSDVDSMTLFLTEDQTRKLELVRQIKREVAEFQFAEVDSRPVDVAGLSRTLWSFLGYLGLSAQAAREESPELAAQLRLMRESVAGLRRDMLAGERAAAQLARFETALFGDIRETFETILNQDHRAPLTVEDLPKAIRNRFIGSTGRHLLMVYPREDIWVRENQETFVRELRSVHPEVTGTPVQLYEYTTLLKKSYEEAAWYALAAIALLAFIRFRSPLYVALSLAPVGIGAIWMAGVMGAFGVPFNPANIMTLPLVVGIGVTNGIHILNRFKEEQNPAILAKSTGKAVLVSALTTIAGFGSLMLAKHQGIASLGFVMSVGVSTCMIAGLTFLPALLTLLIRCGWIMKEPSAENAQSALGPEEPR